MYVLVLVVGMVVFFLLLPCSFFKAVVVRNTQLVLSLNFIKGARFGVTYVQGTVGTNQWITVPFNVDLVYPCSRIHASFCRILGYLSSGYRTAVMADQGFLFVRLRAAFQIGSRLTFRLTWAIFAPNLGAAF